MKSKYKIFAFLGPSATGKTSLMQMMAKEGVVQEVISYTTRAPRPGEQEGVSYHFIDGPMFYQLERAGYFAEHVEFGGHTYGLSRKDIGKALEHGHIGIVVEPSGYRQIRAAYPEDTVAIFIQPPDRDELVARIKRRQPGISDEEVAKRMLADEAIRLFEPEADIKLPPDTVENWAVAIREIIAGYKNE